MRIAAPFIALVALSVIGCASKPEPKERSSQRDSEDTKNAAPSVTRTLGIYDLGGNLRESDERIAGLVLPMGLELVRKTDRKQVFRSTVPVKRLFKYFGPRLFTGNVERVKRGAIYHNAQVQGVHFSSIKLNVSILEVSKGKVRVAVEEIPPPPENVASKTDTRAELQEHLKTLY